MLPILLSCPDKARAQAVIQKYITDNAIAEQYIFRIQREPKKKEISVDQIRSIHQMFIHHHPHTRVVIIQEFDTASEEAQNALLKILEEKTANTQFFLVVTNQFQIVSTIRSRSHIQQIGSPMQPADNPDFQPIATALLKKQITLLSNPLCTNLTTEKALAFCDHLILALRSQFTIETTKVTVLMKEIMRIKKLIKENNLNPQLGIDYLILSSR